MKTLTMKSTRRRVLFLMPSLVGGGAERVIVTLLRHLDRSRFELHLALVEAVVLTLRKCRPTSWCTTSRRTGCVMPSPQ